MLSDDEGATLLRRLIGAQRMDAEPVAATQIVRLCAGSPLALRIASANLADRPHSSLATYAAELAEGNRLAKLTVPGDEDRAVQAVLDRSYDCLPRAAQRAFRLVGLIPGPDFTAEMLTALAGQDAAPELDALVAANLVMPQPLDRFTLHDLVREYAGAKATAKDAPALRGLLEYLRDMAMMADSFVNAADEPGRADLRPQLTSVSEAMSWYETEQTNLAAAVSAALATGEPELAVEISQPVSRFFNFSGRISDWISTFERVCAAAEDLDDTQAKYFMLNSLGKAYLRAGQYDDAIQALHRSADGREALGDEVAAARESLTEAVALAHKVGDRFTEALALAGMSEVERNMGNLAEAIRVRQAVHAIYKEGMPNHVPESLNKLGDLYAAAGMNDKALETYRESLAIAIRRGEQHQHGLALAGIGSVTGERDTLEAALRLLEPISAAHTEHVRQTLESLDPESPID